MKKTIQEVRIGIVGLGGMGSNHARRFVQQEIQGARLAAVCDLRPEALASFAEDIPRFSDSRAMLRSGSIDAVVVATPHYDHTTIGIDALDQGLHLLVEKPISVHKADCERLIAAFERRPQASQVFAAMFNQRTDPLFQKVRELIVKGELGEITRMSWIITNWFRTQSYYDGGGWRGTWAGEGGGVLLNQCPHNLDMLQWLCGVPARIRAFCGIGKWHHIEVEDEVTAYLEFDNGATGTFVTSTGEAPGTNRLEICGDRGRLVLEDSRISFIRNEIPAAEFLRTSPRAFARPEVWNIEVPVSGTAGQHAQILQNFVNAIRLGEPLIAPATEGIRSVEIGNAMLLSHLTGKTVELPLNGRMFERRLKQLIRDSQFQKKATTGARVSDGDLSGSFNPV